MSDESGEVEMNWIVVPVQMSGETGQRMAIIGDCPPVPPVPQLVKDIIAKHKENISSLEHCLADG
jgi:hypothetical protein